MTVKLSVSWTQNSCYKLLLLSHLRDDISVMLLHSAMGIWNLSRADIVIKEFTTLHVQNYRAFSTVLHAYIVEKLKKQRRKAHSRFLKVLFIKVIVKIILAYCRQLGKDPFNIKRKMFLLWRLCFYDFHVFWGTWFHANVEQSISHHCPLCFAPLFQFSFLSQHDKQNHMLLVWSSQRKEYLTKIKELQVKYNKPSLIMVFLF